MNPPKAPTLPQPKRLCACCGKSEYRDVAGVIRVLSPAVVSDGTQFRHEVLLHNHCRERWSAMGLVESA